MNIEELKDNYINFVRENTHFTKLRGESYEVNTMFVNSFGEGISFTVVCEGESYLLTDDGFTLWDLKNNGIDLAKKSKRRDLLGSILNFSGFTLNNKEEIQKKVSRKNLMQAIHDMPQVLLNVYDLSVLHSQNIQTQFFDDVKNYFMTHKKDYNIFPEFSITGKSSLEHKFNFLFMTKNKNKLTKVYNSINKQQLERILISWLDTIEKRTETYGNNEELWIIISKEGYINLKSEYRDALGKYGIKIVNFEEKTKLKKQLGA